MTDSLIWAEQYVNRAAMSVREYEHFRDAGMIGRSMKAAVEAGGYLDLAKLEIRNFEEYFKFQAEASEKPPRISSGD